MKRISSFNVVTIVDGELLIDGDPSGLPTVAELNKKQEKILFIRLTAPSGVLGEQAIEFLNGVNRLVYKNIIYYPTVVDKETKTKIYTAKTSVDTLKQITVNMVERSYEVETLVDTVLQDHINNTEIHVTQEEKNKWNNKVDATTVLIDGTSYNLVLSKD